MAAVSNADVSNLGRRGRARAFQPGRSGHDTDERHIDLLGVAMKLIQFVHQRAVEDAVLAGAVDPPDGDLLHAAHLAHRLIAHCGGHQQRLTPRQHELMLRLADRHRGHGDYDPAWWQELHRRTGSRNS